MSVCPECAKPLPRGLAAGMCPCCLLRLTLGGAEKKQTLGDYEIGDELARGGMGIVYRARQRRLGREVAVKVLRGGEFAGAEAQARFRAEAAAAARLQHPGIVAIHDVGEDAGVLWFSMDLVPGENLAARVREHPLAARDAAQCVQRVAEAVQHAHEHGVLHRDLKPSNILLAPDGQPRVTDFGLARHTTDAAELTRTGQMLGSPGYAAPEQAFGGNADARTDVYGLGALLYHLLTGRPPFQGPTVDSILLQLRENDPLPPRQLTPNLPRDLEIIALHCLAKDPANRYATAREVAADLARFLASETIRARPASLADRGWRWCRRHPAIAALLALVALMTAALVIGSLSFARRQERLEHRTALIADARIIRAEGVSGSRTRALVALREAWAIKPSAELRNEVIACLSLPEITLEKTLAPGATPEPGASADGRWDLRFENNALLVIERATGHENARLTGFAKRPVAQLDDTGTRIAIARAVDDRIPNDVTLHELPSGKVLQTLPHFGRVKCLDWAGELLAVGSEDFLVYVWDTMSGQRLHRFTGHDSAIEAVRFRPHGQELVTIAHDSIVRIWHAALGVEILRIEGQNQSLSRTWWSEDGAHLFCLRENDGAVNDYRIDWSRTAQVLAPGKDEPHSENFPNLSLDATGDLASVVDETGCRVWNLRRGRLAHFEPKTATEWMSARLTNDGASLWLSGWDRALRRLPIQHTRADWPEFGTVEHSGFDSGPLLVATREDGGAVALTNNGNTPAEDYVEVVMPAGWRRVRLAQGDPFGGALSPDGRWALTGSFSEPGARLWSLPDGQLRQTLDHLGIVLGAVFTEDGAALWLWGDKAVQRIRADTWTPISPPIARLFPAFAVSPGGQFAASISGNDVILRRAADLTELARLPAFVGSAGSARLAFSGDSNRLALHTARGTVVVWNLAALEEELRALNVGTIGAK